MSADGMRSALVDNTGDRDNTTISVPSSLFEIVVKCVTCLALVLQPFFAVTPRRSSMLIIRLASRDTGIKTTGNVLLRSTRAFAGCALVEWLRSALSIATVDAEGVAKELMKFVGFRFLCHVSIAHC